MTHDEIFSTPELDKELDDLKIEVTDKLNAIREKYFVDGEGLMISYNTLKHKYAVSFIIDLSKLKKQKI